MQGKHRLDMIKALFLRYPKYVLPIAVHLNYGSLRKSLAKNFSPIVDVGVGRVRFAHTACVTRQLLYKGHREKRV